MSVLITPASALLVPLDENQIKEGSDLIIKGTVVGNTSPYWNNGHDMIYYYFIIEVDEVYKGELSSDAENKVYVLHEGGDVDDVGIWVEDQIELKTGQEVILCLTDGGNTNFGPKKYFAYPQIMSDGNYSKIITDEETEKDVGSTETDVGSTETDVGSTETDVDGIQSLPIFKKILLFFSDFGNFFT